MPAASIGPLGEMCGACHYAVLNNAQTGEADCHGWGKKLKDGGNSALPADWVYPLVVIDQDWCFHFRLFGTGDPGHYP